MPRKPEAWVVGIALLLGVAEARAENVTFTKEMTLQPGGVVVRPEADDSGTAVCLDGSCLGEIRVLFRMEFLDQYPDFVDAGYALINLLDPVVIQGIGYYEGSELTPATGEVHVPNDRTGRFHFPPIPSGWIPPAPSVRLFVDFAADSSFWDEPVVLVSSQPAVGGCCGWVANFASVGRVPELFTDSPGVFCIRGSGNGLDWSWRIDGGPIVDVVGLPPTTQKGLRDAFVTSIEDAEVPTLAIASGPGDACFTAAACCNGDLDGDGTVTASDYSDLLGCIQTEGGACAQADLNCDGTATVADAAILLCQLGAPPDPGCCSASTQSAFQLRVGPPHDPACLVSGNSEGCAFNPAIFEQRFLPTSLPALAPFSRVVLIALLAAIVSAPGYAVYRRRRAARIRST